MEKNTVMIVAEKETFLVRTMEKKIKDARMDVVFSQWNVTEINSKWDTAMLLIMYLEDNERPPEDALHFISEKASETDKLVIPVLEKNDQQYFSNHFLGDLVYKTFYRPLNNDELVSSVQEVFLRVEAGDFKKTILIVDDDPNYLGLVREWLKGTYKVAMANSGMQALRWLGNHKADLILLDYEMPVTSGPQVLEMLRSEPETKNIPVMFLTGKSDKDSVMQVMSLNPQGYFLKSIEREELESKLSEYFLTHIGE